MFLSQTHIFQFLSNVIEIKGINIFEMSQQLFFGILMFLNLRVLQNHLIILQIFIQISLDIIIF